MLLSACLLLALVGPAGARKGRCPRKQSCDQCIRAGPECAWCNHPDITGPRCDTEERLAQAGCVRDLYNPRGGLLSVTNESRWEASWGNTGQAGLRASIPKAWWYRSEMLAHATAVHAA